MHLAIVHDIKEITCITDSKDLLFYTKHVRSFHLFLLILQIVLQLAAGNK